MTQQDDITQRVLTDDELMALLPGAVRLPPGWKDTARAIESVVLSKLRAPVADERAAFEAWATAIAEKYDVTRNGDHYMEPYTEWVWEAWQASRAALASAPVADRQRLRELVDVVWNEATESTAVPDTPWADRLIDKVFPSLAASAPVASLPDVEPEPRTAEDYAIPVVGVGTSAPVAMSETERSAITGLIAVARAAFNVADDAEDDGDQIKVDRADADALSAALDALDELPDDQPGYSMGPSNKAEWALRRLLNAASAPVAGEARPVARIDNFGNVVMLTSDAPLNSYLYAAPQASADALEVARAALMEIADLADVEADQRGVIVNQALTKIAKIAKMTAVPQADKDGAVDESRNLQGNPVDRSAELQGDKDGGQQRAEDAERWRWATATDENAQMLYTIVQAYGGDQQKINERADFYRAALSATQEPPK
ncbi:hypothetical protein SB816_28230 [Achromobacter sp. SIMBA_011]|uniref:hypothetical protein n=1 Tax=Achromobacter sp. SIMBA_011 TaxID=3085759 RepID=UPI003978B3E2